jgi:hypothetical protein
MKILVACHGLVMSGGLMRFERFGREAAKLGHHLVYLCLSGSKAQCIQEAQPRVGLFYKRDWSVSRICQ